MDLAERCADFYDALATGNVRAWFSPRAAIEVDGKAVKLQFAAKRAAFPVQIEECVVKRNLCFVHWTTRDAMGLDILAFNQDGLLEQWSRQLPVA